MTPPAAVSLCGAATVFVVQDVLRAVEHYRDVFGFRTEFTYGQPRSTRVSNGEPQDYAYGMRDFNVNDLDGNQLGFGMESKLR